MSIKDTVPVLIWEFLITKNILSDYIEYEEFNGATFMAVLRHRKKLRNHCNSVVTGFREPIWIIIQTQTLEFFGSSI